MAALGLLLMCLGIGAGGEESHPVEPDPECLAVVKENRYLHQRIRELEGDLDAMSAAFDETAADEAEAGDRRLPQESDDLPQESDDLFQLEWENAQLRARIARANFDRDTLAGEVESMTEATQTLTRVRAELQAKLARMGTNLAAIREESESHEETARRAARELSEAVEEAECREHEQARASAAERDALTADLAALQEQLIAAGTSFSQAVAELDLTKQELEKMRGERQEMAQELLALRAAARQEGGARDEIKRARQSIAEAEQVINQLREQVAAMDAVRRESADREAELAERDRTIEALRITVSGLRAQLARLNRPAEDQ